MSSAMIPRGGVSVSFPRPPASRAMLFCHVLGSKGEIARKSGGKRLIFGGMGETGRVGVV